MADSSFDVVSKLDRMELDNAVNQAAKEVGQRFDFRGTNASIELKGDTIEIKASTDDRVLGALEVLKEKMVRREISLKAIEYGDPIPAAGATSRLVVTLRDGLDSDKAKAVAKLIKAEGLKGVQASINGDVVRVTGKKRDDLQAVIAMLKASDFEVPLQYVNYR